MEDVQKLWIPSSQIYNVLLELLTIGYGCSFHHQGDLTCHLHYCDGQPKVIRKHYMNVPVDKLSIDRTTMHAYSIQSTANNTFCPQVSQGQAIILGWARQVTSRQVTNKCVCVCVCVSV